MELKYKYIFSRLIVSSSVFIACSASANIEKFQIMSDSELSDVSAQSLMSLSHIAPNDSSNLMSKHSSGSNVGFYKLGLEAYIDINANIKKLQLGCGGMNGDGKCDIDIQNLSLSGLPTSNDQSGSPVYSNGRASTSAKLTNPFVEFAIKNPNSASTREVVGLRLSAEQITGLLSAGIENSSKPSQTDGIQNMSGFMRVAQTEGEATTQPTIFGKADNHKISGLLSALGFEKTFTSAPSDADTKGVTIPSMTTKFTIPEFQVNGNRLDGASISGIETKISSIDLSQGPLNQIKVTFPAMVTIFFVPIGTSAKIILAKGSAVNNLNMNITFNQALSMLHNIPLKGNGGYLSLQQESLLWPGSYISDEDRSAIQLNTMAKSDISKRGWWMSFAEPVELGYLKATDQVNIDAVLPQVATLMTAELLKETNRVMAPAGSAILTVLGVPMTTPRPIIIDLNEATKTNPARLSLSNLKLANQEIRSNCYGGLLIC